MTVAVIGAGTIGSAVAKRLASRYEDRVIATDIRFERLKELEKEALNLTTDNKRAAAEADIIFLCVKPKDVGKILEEIQEEVKGKLVISVAAAVTLGFLTSAAPGAKFVRAMPNMAVLVHESFTAYCASADAPSEDKARAEGLLGALGRVVEVDEANMDAITALSGCAPAYLSVMMEAMVRAGVEAGLPKELALAASAQSMVGTGMLVLDAQKQPSEIVGMVKTPGGVTEEELRELQKFPVMEAINQAIKAGAAKSNSISKSLAGK